MLTLDQKITRPNHYAFSEKKPCSPFTKDVLQETEHKDLREHFGGCFERRARSGGLTAHLALYRRYLTRRPMVRPHFLDY